MTEQSGPSTGGNERFCSQCGQPVEPDASYCEHCGAAQHPGGQGSGTQPTQSGTGLEPNIAAALCYLLTWVTGLIFLLIEKDDDYVRFHAKQAIVFGIALIVVWVALSIFFGVFAFIPFIGKIIVGILGTIVWLAFGFGSLILWIVLMIKAYQGQRYEIPILSDLVKKWSTS